MRSRLVLALGGCVLSGCDLLFSLDHVEKRSDAPVSSDGLIDSVDAGEPCRADYEVVAGAPPTSRYRFVNTMRIWEAAEAECEDDSLGDITHLAVLDDPNEMHAVRNYLIAKLFMETGGFFHAHVGYARNIGDAANAFYAVTGAAVPATRPPWAPNEPDNGGVPGTGETITWFGRDEDLVDGPPTYEERYVCECDHLPVTKMFTLR
ncbi:MAG TPA: C-type lectin domain-containing protein [Kofleriaceae bacterium]